MRGPLVAPRHSVSTLSPYGEGVLLQVTRHERDLPNEFGGRGRVFPLVRMPFPSQEEADRWALSRGYLEEWRHPRQSWACGPRKFAPNRHQRRAMARLGAHEQAYAIERMVAAMSGGRT